MVDGAVLLVGDGVVSCGCCLSCSAPLDPRDVVCDLGAQPLANALLTDPWSAEVHYPLRPVVCASCLLVQLPVDLDPRTVFTDSYPFRSGASAAWQEHCDRFAMEVAGRLGMTRESSVLEIGSNDGTLISTFGRLGVRVLGVEPCEEVAREALRRGASTLITSWDGQTAAQMRAQDWKFDLVVANNVLAHVPSPLAFLKDAESVLAPDGVLSIEVPYVGDMIRDGGWDQVYAEHRCYFSVASLSKLIENAGMIVFDAERLPVHGGSIRVYARRLGSLDRAGAWGVLPVDEDAAGLFSIETYRRFAQRPRADKMQAWERLMRTVRTVKEYAPLAPGVDPFIVGYGASAKAAVTMNWLGWGPEILRFVVDTTPAKHGKYVSGVRVPIVEPEALRGAQPDIVVNFLHNWREESERNILDAAPDAEILYPTVTRRASS